MYGQPDHDHSEYARGSDLDLTRHDLERMVDDERNDRRATREELLSEIQGLREHDVAEAIRELTVEVARLTSRVADLKREVRVQHAAIEGIADGENI